MSDNGPVVIVTVYVRDQIIRLVLQRTVDIIGVTSGLLVPFSSVGIRQSQVDPGACRLANMLVSFDMVQHVCGPTQHCGNTLDLIMMSADCKLNRVNIELSDCSLFIDQASVLEKHVVRDRPHRAASSTREQHVVSTIVIR